jgi:hypothetical protein
VLYSALSSTGRVYSLLEAIIFIQDVTQALRFHLNFFSFWLSDSFQPQFVSRHFFMTIIQMILTQNEWFLFLSCSTTFCLSVCLSVCLSILLLLFLFLCTDVLLLFFSVCLVCLRFINAYFLSVCLSLVRKKIALNMCNRMCPSLRAFVIGRYVSPVSGMS